MDGSVKSVKAIMFDIGGVLLEVHNKKYYDYLAKTSGRDVAFVEKIVWKDTLRMERGGISMRQFNEEVARRLGIRMSQVRWLEFYKSHVEVYRDMLNLVHRLHRKYKTAYLTNVDLSKYGYTKHILDLKAFDLRLASCNLHTIKPEHRIFEIAIKRLGVAPEEIIFIDNEIRNVREASRLGIRGIYYTGLSSLRKKLALMLRSGV